MKRRGIVVIGSHDWYGSVFIQEMPKPYPTDGHPDSIDLKEAEEFGQKIAERSLMISSGETGLIPPVPKLPIPLVPPQEEGEPIFFRPQFRRTVEIPSGKMQISQMQALYG